MATVEGLAHDRDALRVEAHHEGTGGVDTCGVHAEEHHAGTYRIGVHRPASLAGNDTVYQCEVALPVLRGRGAKSAVRVSIEDQLVEVQAHSPHRVIPVPVPAPDHALGVAEDVLASAPRIA